MHKRSGIGILLILSFLLIAAGCTQPAPAPATTAPTAIVTSVATAVTTQSAVESSTPGPVQTLLEIWNIDVQVTGNGEAIDPMIIATIRGGKGLNAILQVDVQVTRADGKVETGTIKRQGTYRVGDSVSLPVTAQMGNVNRVEVFATTPQGDKVKIFDDLVPFRTYN